MSLDMEALNKLESVALQRQHDKCFRSLKFSVHVLLFMSFFLSFYKLTKYTPHSQSVMMVMTDLYNVLTNKLSLTEGDLKHS